LIQPIVVSRYNFLDSKRKFFGRGHSVIRILPEVSTKGMEKDDVDSLLSNVQNMMQEAYEKLNDETAAANNMKYF
jgi:lysophosphatidate acyltransferase